MIQGLGTDIIEIERIRASIARHGNHFLDKIYTATEQEYCLKHSDSAPFFAGRFSAKEAIVKALGCGFRDGITWLDIEIYHDPQGKPFVRFSDLINERFNTPQVHISISHCKSYATATAIYEK